MTSRDANLARLQEGPLDVLILGGGINGAGIARDLALRCRRAGVNLRIGLVEQRHFASGTSGKNSQLIHGGLRYLKSLEFGLVSESLRERPRCSRSRPTWCAHSPFWSPCTVGLRGCFMELVWRSTMRWLAHERYIGIVP